MFTELINKHEEHGGDSEKWGGEAISLLASLLSPLHLDLSNYLLSFFARLPGIIYIIYYIYIIYI